MAKSNERNPSTSIIPIGSIATGTTAVLPGLYFRKHSRIKNVYFSDKTGIAKSNSDHVTISLQDLAGPTAYASVDTSASAAVAVTPLALALATPDDADTNHLEKDVPAGSTLNAKVITAGAAVCTSAVLIVEWYPA